MSNFDSTEPDDSVNRRDRAFLRINMLVSMIEENALTIKELKEKGADLRSRLNINLTNIMEWCDFDDGELQSTYNTIYWNMEIHSIAVFNNSYKLVTGEKFTPTPRKIKYTCRKCKDITREEAKSLQFYLNRKKERLCEYCRGKKNAIIRKKQQARAIEEQKLREEHRDAERLSTSVKMDQYQKNIEYLRALPYQEYLQTDHWNNIRQKAYRSAGYRCQLCNNKGRLNTHHRTYERLGCEWMSDLIVLCEKCHEKFHNDLPTAENDQ